MCKTISLKSGASPSCSRMRQGTSSWVTSGEPQCCVFFCPCALCPCTHWSVLCVQLNRLQCSDAALQKCWGPSQRGFIDPLPCPAYFFLAWVDGWWLDSLGEGWLSSCLPAGTPPSQFAAKLPSLPSRVTAAPVAAAVLLQEHNRIFMKQNASKMLSGFPSRMTLILW